MSHQTDTAANCQSLTDHIEKEQPKEPVCQPTTHNCPKKDVIVYQHLDIPDGVAKLIKAYLGNPFDVQAAQKMRDTLAEIAEKTFKKYDAPALKEHIKLIYIFLTEGMAGSVKGSLIGSEEEKEIKKAFADKLPLDFPIVQVIGMAELQPMLARVEALNPGLKFREFLLNKEGKNGYDTPKIAAALIQLARREYERQEMFIRIDDDVEPNADGIAALKKVYYDLVNNSDNKQFCFSWNYFAHPIEPVDPLKGTDYDALFDHFVNDYSIRTTFLGDPTARVKVDPDNMTQGSLESWTPDPQKTPCRLNIIHAKFFVDLFQQGKWGSNLHDPISGAGMCFSADSLQNLPPWCNADELISWIDDMVKYETMQTYYGKGFDDSYAMLGTSAGFRQTRNEPAKFSIGNVAWSTNVYLDRLLIGCILAFALNPHKFGVRLEGYGQVLQEPDYATALQRWELELREPLFTEADAHIRRILQDWQYFFCATANPGATGAINPNSVRYPDGFVRVGGDHFFNAYVIRHLLRLQSNQFDLTHKVFTVLDKYLKMKYVFWPLVVRSIEDDRKAYETAKASTTSTVFADFKKGPSGWLYICLDKLTATSRPTKRDSRASFAIITRTTPDGKPREPKEWLLQWNPKWQVMNLIGGHKIDQDVNDVACVIREIHEEVFVELSEQELGNMNNAVASDNEHYTRVGSTWQDPFIESIHGRSVQGKASNPYKYVEYSKSAKCVTLYTLYIYDVAFRTDVALKLFHLDPFYTPEGRCSPKEPNEWVTVDDIKCGWTKMGRKISRTVQKVLGELLKEI